MDSLDLRKIEVRLGYQNRGFRDVRLMQLVLEMMSGGQEDGSYCWKLKEHSIPDCLLRVPVDDIALDGRSACGTGIMFLCTPPYLFAGEPVLER